MSKISPATLKTTILAARDTIGKLTGYVYKFKPREATKLAGSIAKWAGPVGAAFTIGSDLWDAYKAHEREQELKEVKASLAKIIKEPFEDIYDVLSSDEKMFAFLHRRSNKWSRLLLSWQRKVRLFATTGRN